MPATESGTDRSGQDTAIAHSCGHDMHVTWLMGATRILAENRDEWRGTVMAVFQPAEETGEGARAMVEDGMVKRFPKPDMTLGQHVMPLSAGQIGWPHRHHALGRGQLGGDAVRPRRARLDRREKTVDPVVMAAAAVMRLQTVVSREIAHDGQRRGQRSARCRPGMSENIIPDRGAAPAQRPHLQRPGAGDRASSSIRRILNAEAAASGRRSRPRSPCSAGFR